MQASHAAVELPQQTYMPQADGARLGFLSGHRQTPSLPAPRVQVIGKEIVARPIMNVALTYDHRLIDGREGVTFLKRVKEIVEDPRRLLIDV